MVGKMCYSFIHSVKCKVATCSYDENAAESMTLKSYDANVMFD